MKTQLTIVRIILLCTAIFSCTYASKTYESANSNEMYHQIVGTGNTYTAKPDSAADGAVAGFAVLSGLSLVALAITYLRKED